MVNDNLHIIMPIKDSLEIAERAIRAIVDTGHTLCVYDDNSQPANAERLDALANELGITVVHIAELTDHPSPNYLLVLQTAQREALAEGAALCIVESDVTLRPDTLQALCDGADARPDCGIAAAVTVDEQGVINYPYLHAKGKDNQVLETKKHCSFCCSLLTPALLERFAFTSLNPEKNWFDVTISHESLACGLKNYLFTNLPVLHRPHQSRPWKQLKYKNPLLYYWKKITKGLDKI